jgi:hypothetical protein
MTRAIEFDCEFCFFAKEIDDPASDRVLPPKF